MKLKISKISVKDIDDTGSMFDKQDPAVEIKIGSVRHTTERQKDAGTNASYPEQFEFTISSADLASAVFEVEAQNLKDSGGVKSVIGAGSSKISDVLPNPNEPKEISIDLITPKKKWQKGTIIFTAEIIDDTPPPVAKAVEAPPPTVKPSPPAAAAAESAPTKPAAVETPAPAEQLGAEATKLKPSANASPAETVASSAEATEKIQSDLASKPTNLNGSTAQKTAAAVSKPPVGKDKSENKKDKVKEPVPSAASPADAVAVTPISAAPVAPSMYKLHITNIEARELANIGNMFDKQDPAVRITVCGQTKETARMKDAGTSASYSETFVFDVPASELDNAKIKAEVHNMKENNESKGVVGSGETSLSGVPPDGTSTTARVIDLSAKKKSQGQVLLKCRLEPVGVVPPKSAVTKNKFEAAPPPTSEPEVELSKVETEKARETEPVPSAASPADAVAVTPISAAPTAPSMYKLHITSIEARELANIGNMFDKQDPAVRITVCGQTKETARMKDAGTSASYSETFVFDVPASELDNAKIKAEVHNMKENNESKGVVGSGETSLSGVPPDGTSTTARVIDLSAKKKSQGQVLLKCRLEPVGVVPPKSAVTTNKIGTAPAQDGTDKERAPSAASPAEAAESVPAALTTPSMYKLHITNIEARELANIGNMFDKQDPAVRITVCGQTKETARMKDAGTSASYSETFVFDVPASELDNAKIKAEVHNMKENNESKGVVGSGETSLSGVPPDGTSTTARVIDLSAKKKSQGQVLLKCRLEPVGVVPRPVAEEKASGASTSAGAPSLSDTTKFTLRIRKIEARNLTKVEMIGENDPFVNLKIGDIWNAKTSTLDNTGAVGDWTYPDTDASQMVISTTKKVLETSKMQISVFDENSLRSHKKIGDAEQSLFPLIPVVTPLGYGETVITFHLTDAAGKASGTVRITFGVQIEDKKSSGTGSGDKKLSGDTVDDNGKAVEAKPFEEGVLHIKRIKCFDLKNVEKMGFMGDQNDPYVTVRLGSWDEKTEHKDGEGSNPLWEYLNFKSDVTSDIIAFEKLKIQVYDHNTVTSDVLIGSSDATLYHLVTPENLGKEVDVTVILKDDRGKTTGKVVLGAEIRPHDGAADSKNAAIAEGFSKGVLQVVRVRAFGLLNTELIGKQDPYVKLSFGTLGPKRTITKDNAGSSALWDYLDIAFDVTSETLCSTELMVEAWDDNNSGDRLIGTGSVSVRKVGSILDKEVELELPLVAKDGKSSAGQIVLFCKVSDPPPAVDPVATVEIEDGLVGIVKISRVTLTDVINTEFFGKQDLYAKLSFGDWVQKLPVKSNDGQTVTWKDIVYSFPVTSDTLRAKTFDITVYDENKLRKDVLIGTYSVSLTQSVAKEGVKGTEVILHGALPPDKKGVASGRVEVALHIEPPEPQDDDLKVNSDFVNGYIHVRKIMCTGLRNTELVGKQDPYIVVSLGESSYRTDTLQDIGSDPAWNFLDMKYSVTCDVLQTQSLKIQAFDENTTSDTLIGESTVRIVKAGVKIGDVVELQCELHNQKALAKEKGGNSGVVTLLVSAHPPEKVIAPPASSIPVLPEAFQEGTVYITSIQAFGLKNTEFFGKQDPYVVVKIGETMDVKTKVLQDSGAEVIWEDLDFSAKIKPSFINEGMIEFKVMDENSLRKNTVIGIGKTPIRRLASRLGKEQNISVNLEDSSGKIVGRLAVNAEMRETEPDSDKALPEGFVSGLLHITRIRSFDLKNLDMLSKQDPYIKFKYEAWEEKTYTQNEAGGDVLWDFLDFRTVVTAGELMSGNAVISFEAMEDNPVFDESIGTGKASLDSIRTIGEEVELSVDLKDKNDRNTGRLSVWVVLEEAPPEKDPEVNETFESGYVHIKRVCVFGLKNTEWFGQADPYVALKYGSWEQKTNTLKDKGGDVIWDYLDFRTDVTANALRTQKLEVTAMDLNSKLVGDTLIGKGNVSIQRAGAKIGKDVEISIPLFDAKNNSAGRAVVYLSVNFKDETIYTIPEDFKFGTLNIIRIRTFDLKNTELFGEADPFIVLKFGIWNDKTYTQDDAGGTVLWDFLDMRCDVSDDTVSTLELEVEAWDENKGTKNTLIGTGTTKLLKAASKLSDEVELPVSLVDEKGKNSGRLVIYANISEDAVLEIPDSFKKGELNIKRVKASGLKNTEMFGGTPNCYAKLTLDEFEQTTKVTSENGLDPVWDRLDYKSVVSAKTVKGREIAVELWNKNTLMKDVLIGRAEVPLRRAGGKLNQDIDIFADLLDEKGKQTGRATLLVNLKELPPDPEADLGLPPDFSNGVVEIVKVLGFGLKNKELIGKQDPYVRINLLKQEERTDTLDNAGPNPVWPKTKTIQFEVDADVLMEDKLHVSVWDENKMRSDKPVGSGKVSLRRLCPRVNNEVELSVDLNENGVVAGRVVLHAILRPATKEELVETIPESAITVKQGLFTVKKITVDNIVGGDTGFLGGGKQDPYIVLSLDKWTARTTHQEEAGTSAVWEDIDGMQTAVTGDVLKFKRLNVSVYDKDTVTADEFIGEGDASLRGIGSQATTPGNEEIIVPITVKIKDKRGARTGEVKVYATVEETVVKEDTASNVKAVDGLLHIQKIEALQVKGGGLISKASPCVELAIGTMWRHSTDINKDAGNNTSWNSNICCKMTNTQLRRDPVKIKVLDSGKVVGEGNVTALPLFTKPGKVSKLKCDLTHHGEPAGTIILTAKFEADVAAASSDKERDTAPRGDMAMHHDDNGKEKKQIKADNARENNALAEAFAKQTAMLQKNLDMLAKKLENQEKGSWHGLTMSELNSLKLPLRVADWRSAHVQAWLALRMDLPQYVSAFQEASVDGLVLVSCIGDEALNDDLGVTAPLHRRKIMEGIKTLQAKEDEYRLQDESRVRKTLREAIEAQPQQKNKMKKKKKKKKVYVEPENKTWTGVVREENEIERVKLVRDMKAYREAQARKAKKADTSKTWKFEYTGAEKPRGDELWGDDVPPHQSRAYDKTMADLLNTTDTTGGYVGPVRSVPSNLSFDEVLTVIKGAMFDTSTRLVRIEEANQKKQDILDSDLESEDEESLPPPYDANYVEVGDSMGAGLEHISTGKMSSSGRLSKTKPKADRTGLIFNAFVGLQNNGARWIGANDKLTRLKFYGGFEAILRLKIDWPQFDTLWNQLDYVRSGELDKYEFKSFFGDLSEFENNEGAGALSTQTGSESMKAFTKILFEFCDILRHTGFSVIDIFSSFDRNGSGDVSVSEFCSMLRTVLGKQINKKQIYKAYALFDADNSRTISLDEILRIVYKIWKAELDELADKLHKLDEERDTARIDMIVKERGVLKECIKKNFPRQWRDKMARCHGPELAGPFTNLLNSLNIGSKAGDFSTGYGDTYDSSMMGSPGERDMAKQMFAAETGETSPTFGTRGSTRMHGRDTEAAPPRPPGTRKPASATVGGRNEVMRFKLVNPESHVPHRDGAVLRAPKAKSLNDPNLFSGEGAKALLRKTEPVGIKFQVLTSDT